MFENEPFITGSRVYGEPREDSDLDLVVHMPAEVAEEIWGELFPEKPTNYGAGAFSIFRFGQLNLIATHTQSAFYAWREGTNKCLAQRLTKRKPLTRSEAVTIIRKELDKRGIDE